MSTYQHLKKFIQKNYEHLTKTLSRSPFQDTGLLRKIKAIEDIIKQMEEYEKIENKIMSTKQIHKVNQ